MEEGDFLTSMHRVEHYKFQISFNSEKIESIFTDEPEPLGKGEYPNAGKLLAAAVGNCLCASLVFCMEKYRSEVPSICAEVSTSLGRNEQGRLRITHMSVKIFPQVSDELKFQRCREIFEDFCIVTQSVRQGIDVNVEVFPVKPLPKAPIGPGIE
jgi:uncharacterized OsmC-like protein